MEKEQDRAVIDTNLLVRYLTEDDPEKAKAVYTGGVGEIEVAIRDVVQGWNETRT